MQGRPGPDRQRAWDEKQTEARLAALRATNQHRAISPRSLQRPPNMARLNTPPETPRVPRPQRETAPPTNARRRTFILIACIAAIAVIAGVIGTLLGSGILQSSGPASTAANFLGALSNQDYQQAYQDLGPSITLRLSEDAFTKQATALDQRYGKIVDYKEVPNSARNENGKQSYTYTIKRANYNKEYKLQLVLQDVASEGSKIIDYGNSLGPGQ